MYQEYPKFLYDGLEGIVVENAEEEATLGDGYTAFPVAPGEEPPVKRKPGRPPKVKE